MITNSLAYRSGPVYRRFLSALPAPRKLRDKEDMEGVFVTMCGERHLLMLEQTLFSIAIFSERYPRIHVYSDGSLAPQKILDRLAWWPGEIASPDTKPYETWTRKNDWPALLEYSHKNGFGRKLLVIAAEAEKNPFVWFDADILFYSDIANFFDQSEGEQQTPISSALDWCYGYDDYLTNGPLAWLKELPPVNTGFLQVTRGFYGDFGLEELVSFGIASCNPFTEQTILASVIHRVGNIKWSLSEIDISDDDKRSLRPTFLRKKVPCRHYITPIRHLFWRDALALRLGLRP